MKANEILTGDVLDILPQLKAQNVNCIITSPPYFGLRDYDLPPTHWPGISYSPMAGLPSLAIPPMICCLGLEDSIKAYVGHMVLVFRGLWRVLRDDGIAWLNLGDSYGTGTKANRVEGKRGIGYNTQSAQDKVPRLGEQAKQLLGIPWRVALALQADGWYLRSDVIWDKKNPMPESVTDRPTKAHEYVFLLAKSERYYYDQDAIREAQVTQSLDEAIKRCGKGGAQYDKWEDKNGFRGKGGLSSDTKSYNPAGRNKRTVWSIATKPFKEAHFAVMPEDLVEPCLLAGCPGKVCAECGEPWVRVVKKEIDGSRHWSPKDINPNRRDNDDSSRLHNQYFNYTVKSNNFIPTCQCCPLPSIYIDKVGYHWPRYEVTRPGLVLDPFFGAGTVGVVAHRLGRDWLGIELNPEYAQMAQKRLDGTQPALFAL